MDCQGQGSHFSPKMCPESDCSLNVGGWPALGLGRPGERAQPPPGGSPPLGTALPLFSSCIRLAGGLFSWFVG